MNEKELRAEALRNLAAKRGYGTPGDESYNKFMKNIGSNPNYGVKTQKPLQDTVLGSTPNQIQTIDAMKKRRKMFGGGGKGVDLGSVFKKAFSS